MNLLQSQKVKYFPTLDIYQVLLLTQWLIKGCSCNIQLPANNFAPFLDAILLF